MGAWVDVGGFGRVVLRLVFGAAALPLYGCPGVTPLEPSLTQAIRREASLGEARGVSNYCDALPGKRREWGGYCQDYLVPDYVRANGHPVYCIQVFRHCWVHHEYDGNGSTSRFVRWRAEAPTGGSFGRACYSVPLTGPHFSPWYDRNGVTTDSGDEDKSCESMHPFRP